MTIRPYAKACQGCDSPLRKANVIRRNKGLPPPPAKRGAWDPPGWWGRGPRAGALGFWILGTRPTASAVGSGWTAPRRARGLGRRTAYARGECNSPLHGRGGVRARIRIRIRIRGGVRARIRIRGGVRARVRIRIRIRGGVSPSTSSGQAPRQARGLGRE